MPITSATISTDLFKDAVPGFSYTVNSEQVTMSYAPGNGFRTAFHSKNSMPSCALRASSIAMRLMSHAETLSLIRAARAFVRSAAPLPSVDIDGLFCRATGMVYQNNGSSRAPHCRLK